MKMWEWISLGLVAVLIGTWIFGAITAPPELSVGQDFLYEQQQVIERKIEAIQKTIEVTK